MKKKIAAGSLSLLIVSLVWYFFIKKYDYVVTFNVKTSPGIIFQGTLDWEENLMRTDSISSQIVSKTPFSNIVQELRLKDSTLIFNWFYTGINDSVSKVEVGVIDKKNSFLNRINLPFSSEGIKKIAVNKVKNFKSVLEQHLKTHIVKMNGISEIPEQFCAYISIESTMETKAQQMISNNSTIMLFLRENHIQIAGKPFLEVYEWNIQTQKVKYNYCFPIKQSDSLPQNNEVKFKKINSKKALKATYYGNYRTSDRAWFSIYDYAIRNNITIENTPLEIFYNNPFMGGNELEWRAEIFMPIVE